MVALLASQRCHAELPSFVKLLIKVEKKNTREIQEQCRTKLTKAPAQLPPAYSIDGAVLFSLVEMIFNVNHIHIHVSKCKPNQVWVKPKTTTLSQVELNIWPRFEGLTTVAYSFASPSIRVKKCNSCFEAANISRKQHKLFLVIDPSLFLGSSEWTVSSNH